MCLTECLWKGNYSVKSSYWLINKPLVDGQFVFVCLEFWEYQRKIVGSESHNSRSEVKTLLVDQSDGGRLSSIKRYTTIKTIEPIKPTEDSQLHNAVKPQDTRSALTNNGDTKAFAASSPSQQISDPRHASCRSNLAIRQPIPHVRSITSQLFPIELLCAPMERQRKRKIATEQAGHF
jgi:hypothetical protein